MGVDDEDEAADHARGVVRGDDGVKGRKREKTYKFYSIRNWALGEEISRAWLGPTGRGHDNRDQAGHRDVRGVGNGGSEVHGFVEPACAYSSSALAGTCAKKKD